MQKTKPRRQPTRVARLAKRGLVRTQFHVLLTSSERKKLAALSKARGLNAADVVRQLIASAKR